MPYSKLDLWDWLALALLLLCVGYIGVLIGFLHYWREAFDAVQGWVGAFKLNPNRLLAFSYPPDELVPLGYLITRQVNLLLVPLVGYYLVFRIRADILGREPITGLDLLFGIASTVLLPLLIVIANHAPEMSTSDILGSRTAGAIHAYISRDVVGGAAYLVGCLILGNGVTYLPAFVISRLLGRIRRVMRARRRRGEGAPGSGAIARARWLSDIEGDPNALALLRDAADTAVDEVSAMELLHGLTVSTGLPVSVSSALSEEFSEHSGVQATTTGTWRVEAPYGHGVVAFLGAIAGQNIEPARVNEVKPGRKLWIAATIPSSPSSWKGLLTFTLEGSAWSFRADVTVVFPGQLFAWGRGRRILSRLERDMGRYLAELAQRRV